MSRAIHTELSWLPRPPEDFRALCRSALDTPSDLVGRLRFLASHAIDENGLDHLAQVVGQARSRRLSLAPLIPVRLGILSCATSHFVAPALVGTALRHGMSLSCVEASFGQAMQDALSPDSAINRARPEVVLLALDYRGLPLRATPDDADAAAGTVAACLAQVDAMRAGIHQNSGAVCLIQTLARPPESLFGSLDPATPGTVRSLIEAINRGLVERVADSSDLLFDVAGLAETVGLADWHDPTLWNMAKLPFSPDFLPLYADHVCRLVAAFRGLCRRCLILDLDNTVWGGVVGDDGVDGIILGQGDPTGEAYLSVQRAALELRRRGVLLAVSSKNEDATARLPFQQHPEMLLTEGDIAAFHANWADKARNIQTIAAELSLGLESMVFLDDNPVERGLVRRLLPQVAVPELPEDPALYARTLAAAGYFEAVEFSAEDRQRATYYQHNVKRLELQAQAGDIDAYLASLDMEISFQPFDDMGRGRIAQLIAKSNQFNLTTRRYSEADIERIQADPDCVTLQVRLTDVFGDNGMISVVICRQGGDAWDIDTWAMSCRVLGRKVENAVLRDLRDQARRHGIRQLIGHYVPTARNGLVAGHYAGLGFDLVQTRSDGSSVWQVDVEAIAERIIPVTVHRPAREAPDA